jgi:hypothetical protein
VHWLWDLMESPVTDPASLRRRIRVLTAIHLVLPAACLAVLGLVVWRIRHLVTLSQRSNVETALIGFVTVFLLYLLVTTAPATRGALALVFLALRGRARFQQRLQERAGRGSTTDKRAYLNVRVHAVGGGPIEVPIADEVGGLGRLRVEGVEVAFLGVSNRLSTSTFRLVAETLGRVGEPGNGAHSPRVVAWDGIDPESSERYASAAWAFVRLEAVLDKGPLWPSLAVAPAGVEQLAVVMREVTPFLREDIMLPDIEYSAEFSIPIIPEPLAFMQLSRQQQHADSVASLGAATIVVLVILAVIAWLIAAPPWVPGK